MIAIDNPLSELPDSLWNGIARRYRRGMWWNHDGGDCAKAIVIELGRHLGELGSPIIVSMDEEQDKYENPVAIIIYVDGRTMTIPMTFRRRLARVGDTDVFVSHDDGARVLARAMVSEIRKVLSG